MKLIAIAAGSKKAVVGWEVCRVCTCTKTTASSWAPSQLDAAPACCCPCELLVRLSEHRFLTIVMKKLHGRLAHNPDTMDMVRYQLDYDRQDRLAQVRAR